MRILLLIASLLAAGCTSNSGSFDAEYSQIGTLLQSEQYATAEKRIDAMLQQAAGPPDARVHWRFRLLKAETLLGERRLAEAAALLRSDPPDGPEWTEYRARTLVLRGTTEYYLAHYSEAEGVLARAAVLARQSGSASLAAEVQLRQANLSVSQGRFDAAEGALQQVIRQTSDLHEGNLEATATGSLGSMLVSVSRYDDAIVWYERAQVLHTKLGANRSVARDEANLGFCYHRLGDYENAKHHYQKASDVFAKTGDLFDEQILIGDGGTLLYDTGDFAGAANAYRRALETARKVQNGDWASRWASSLAALTAEMGDWDTAERYNTEAITLERRLRSKPFDAMVLSTSGRIAAGRGQFREAERLFREAMNRPARDPRYTLIAQTELARLYEHNSQPRRADEEFQATVRSIDRLNAGLLKEDYKFGYLASLINFYRQYVDFLLGNHQPARALAVAESSRTHVLAQRSGRAIPTQSHTADAYQKLAQQAHAILLEYWLGDAQSYLWVITPRRIYNYRLPPAKSIQELVENYQRVVLAGRNPLEAAADTGRKLYDALLAPAAKDLCPRCRVILVPDQDLYSLNFESLPAPSGGYWIENTDVEVAPSLDYLVDAGPHNSRRSERKSVLVLGNPTSALPEFPKLEYAAREIGDIRATMGEPNAKVLSGQEARPDSYKRAQPGQFEFIHFSAHATANTQSPLDSAVILSGPPDRCRLFARDVMSVPLTAELVTISACRSAGAKTYAGEGPVGLAWAFLRAGARNVIAGLWDVNDRSTEELMSGLYAEIGRGSSPADALRAAKLSFIHAGGSYAKPFYWAPFQVYTGAIN